MEWISVEERLPEEGRRVIVASATMAQVGTGSYHLGGCGSSSLWDTQGLEGWLPTHWKPLPGPPDNGEECSCSDTLADRVSKLEATVTALNSISIGEALKVFDLEKAVRELRRHDMPPPDPPMVEVPFFTQRRVKFVPPSATLPWGVFHRKEGWITDAPEESAQRLARLLNLIWKDDKGSTEDTQCHCNSDS